MGASRLLIACALTLIPASLAAQTGTAAISGLISDPSGAPVADVFVRVTNSVTHEARVVRSNGFGLSVLTRDLQLIEGSAAFLILAAVGIIDTWLLYRFFSVSGRFKGKLGSDPEYAAK